MKLALLSRVLFIIGLIFTFMAWAETCLHITDPLYLLSPLFPEGIHHAQYHAFREVVSEFTLMVIFSLLFFGPRRWRNQITWSVALLLMLGFYLPYWIGAPFLFYLNAPFGVAQFIHIAAAGFSVSGLLLGYKFFVNG